MTQALDNHIDGQFDRTGPKESAQNESERNKPEPDGTQLNVAGAKALERISVRPPYFGLTALEAQGNGLLTAEVPPAVPTDPEIGAIEAAQVARHLAILGSCAAALAREDDDRHHYLASKAHYSRLSNAPAAVTEPLVAEAIASWVDRRTARALVKLSTRSGRGLNLLDVQYTVLTPKMFARFNPPSATEPDQAGGPVGPDNAAQTLELPFDIEEVNDGLLVNCGPIPTALCAGHFPDYPAAPVAIVMGQLCRAAGLAMHRHLDRPDGRYRVEEGHVSASKLGRAGQELSLRACYKQPVRGGHQLVGFAYADKEQIGELEVTLSSRGPAPIDQTC